MLMMAASRSMWHGLCILLCCLICEIAGSPACLAVGIAAGYAIKCMGCCYLCCFPGACAVLTWCHLPPAAVAWARSITATCIKQMASWACWSSRSAGLHTGLAWVVVQPAVCLAAHEAKLSWTSMQVCIKGHYQFFRPSKRAGVDSCSRQLVLYLACFWMLHNASSSVRNVLTIVDPPVQSCS